MVANMEAPWEDIRQCLIAVIHELNKIVDQLKPVAEQECPSGSALIYEQQRKINVASGLYDDLQVSKITGQDKISISEEGDFCTVNWNGTAVRVKNSKGIRLLSVLADNPGRQFHVIDLERYERKEDPDHYGASFSPLHAGPILDDQAKNSYKERLQELRDELDEAQRFNDVLRATKIREEIAILTRELARALGLHGDRMAISEAERARVRTTLAIKGVIGKISGYNSSIGWHLAISVKTGLFCSYQPHVAIDRVNAK